MKFTKPVDIWALDEVQISNLKRGQWVTAGGNLGVFCGVRPSGSAVVMWQGNAKGRADYRDYRRALMDYGKPLAQGEPNEQ